MAETATAKPPRRQPLPCTLDTKTRELLTLAAKAADIEIVEWVGDQANVNMDGGYYGWNPLARWGTGEALSLAVKLQMKIAVTRSDRVVVSCGSLIWDMKCQPDLLAATQRGIVLVAAEVAKQETTDGVSAYDQETNSQQTPMERRDAS